MIFKDQTDGSLHRATLGVGLAFIPTRLFSGDFQDRACRELCAQGILEVVPPQMSIDLRRVPHALREGTAHSALKLCNDLKILGWARDLVGRDTPYGVAIKSKIENIKDGH